MSLSLHPVASIAATDSTMLDFHIGLATRSGSGIGGFDGISSFRSGLICSMCFSSQVFLPPRCFSFVFGARSWRIGRLLSQVTPVDSIA